MVHVGMSAAAFPHEAPPIDDAMSEQTETRYERRRPWSDPGIILQFIALMLAFVQMFILVCGALLGSYMFLRTSAATSEVSNAGLAEKLNTLINDVKDVNRKLDRQSDDVKAVEKVNTEQDGKLNALTERVNDIKTQYQAADEMLKGEQSALRSGLADVKAKQK